jgi:hypothetical protein
LKIHWILLAVSISNYSGAVRCFSLFLAVFFAVIAAVSRCYFPGVNAESQGFPRQWPTFLLLFSWNNTDNSMARGASC